MRVLGVVGVALLALAGCNTGAYPFDLFPEMHYQQSYRAQEPPRLAPPAGSVPVQGGEPRYDPFEARSLRNPVPATPESLARSKKLFQVNCQVCHGAQGRGNGPMAQYFQRDNQRAPADFTSDAVKSKGEGELFWSLTNGLGQMPPFGALLSAQDRWTLLHFIRNPG